MVRRPYRGTEGRALIRSIAIELAVIAALAVAFLVAFKLANKRLGIADAPAQEEAGNLDLTGSDSLVIPGIQPVAAAPADLVEGPESSWRSTPCSLFVSGTSRAVIDSIPEAPTTSDIPYEALLVARRWAILAGVAESDLEKVYVFNRLDTLYVDLPALYDIDGLRRTIEGRFVCFTRLFVLAGGMPVSGFPDGTALRGVPGTFDR
jgi:hypothetical protein